MVAVDDDAGACGRGVPTLINNMFSMNAFNVKRVFLMWFRCDFFILQRLRESGMLLGGSRMKVGVTRNMKKFILE